MEYLITRCPAWFLCFAFVVVMVGISCLMLWAVRAFIKRDVLDGYRDVGGILFGAGSLIYSLLLAFAIVAVWGQYEAVDSTVTHESAKLFDMSQHARELPAPAKEAINKTIEAYAAQEVSTEWNNISYRFQHNPMMHDLQRQLRQMDTLQTMDKEILDQINHDIEDVNDIRSDRVSNIQSHIPFLAWVVLIVGSLMVVSFAYFFRMPPGLHYLFTSLVTCMVAMCMFLLFMLDNPLCGTSGVSSRPLMEFVK